MTAAQRAFAQVEEDISHFYELRDQPVSNPERTLARVAREQKLSERLRIRSIDTLASAVTEEDGELSMFDVINHVTNLANAEGVKRGVRLELERFGGSALRSAHDERCRICASRLN